MEITAVTDPTAQATIAKEAAQMQNAFKTTQVKPARPITWTFGVPPAHLRSRPLLVLTIMGIGITTVWSDAKFGEHFVGWTENPT